MTLYKSVNIAIPQQTGAINSIYLINLVMRTSELNYIKNLKEPGMMMHAYNPSTQEAKARGSQVPGQPGLHSKTLTQKQKI
jgi:hypothetical protein